MGLIWIEETTDILNLMCIPPSPIGRQADILVSKSHNW